jgi:hypothetical protein
MAATVRAGDIRRRKAAVKGFLRGKDTGRFPAAGRRSRPAEGAAFFCKGLKENFENLNQEETSGHIPRRKPENPLNREALFFFRRVCFLWTGFCFILSRGL